MRISKQEHKSPSKKSTLKRAIIPLVLLSSAFLVFKLTPKGTTALQNISSHALAGDTIKTFTGKFNYVYTVEGENEVSYTYKGSTRRSTLKYRWSHGYCGGTDGHLYYYKSSSDHNIGYRWTGNGLTEFHNLDSLCYFGSFWTDRWYFETKDNKCYYWTSRLTREFVDCYEARMRPKAAYGKPGEEIIDFIPYSFEATYRGLPTSFSFDPNGLPDDVTYIDKYYRTIPKRLSDLTEAENYFIKGGSKHFLDGPYTGMFADFNAQGVKVAREFRLKRWVPASDQFSQ